ncbi:hypothetical protein COV24_00360 [candidate division WWE3 bacterium CG10_big_fil_rev_8_21_14_0_10_32_10]|uniref:Uncharacterized protein n=1 Tax=candidate division WWE3 bacterium CG10_big_fil_rev_8_21_14_0_10_32_10 TaxID=1975090 RepID=A0A2H0RBP6_UNCKA|nr:MAG: hypothetical protein COV24_00360 [candidate division WWE3 bacterium CG10_big_fil_rev_8_21_14_0_10_32_10]
MSRVVLSNEERKVFFKDFIDAIDYSQKAGILSDFLLDFFSQTELDSFIKRLEVFKRLHTGHSYAKLNQDLSVSPITASKVSRSLRDSSDSFKGILDALSSPAEVVTKSQPVQKDNKRSSYLG